ncbi:MAG: dihydropteroate synthase family protein, partial [Verrucomicrobiota bacterium]|nr:dihydropteroate synthase family protein [Verrucomicrobiota bacterium]
MTVRIQSASTWQSPHGRPLPAVGGRTLIMGILNVTPDSFSDGGQLPTPQAVVDRAGALLAAGADVLDIGGESTRPGAASLSAAEETDRVLPAVTAVRRAFRDAPISIDTYKAVVAEAVIRAGADIVNDIWGGTHGLTIEQRNHWTAAQRRGEALPAALPRSPMAAAAAALGCPLILMHNRPDRNYGDFLADVILDLCLSLALAREAGVPEHQIWLDPGFGFAKEPAQNLEVLKNLHRIVALGYPVMLGTSRKSTIGRVLGAPVDEREVGTGATLAWGVQQGCAMVRVHDVAA